MQGVDAVDSIIQALEQIFQFEDFFDAVAIIRGGGATADLSCFDNYELAFHVTQFPIPVVTGIGHEKDDTIIDMVAHTRMKTPTAVAEFFINGVERFYDSLLETEHEIIRLVQEKIDEKKYALEHLAGDFQQSVGNFIRGKNDALNRNGNKLQREVSRFSFNRNYELNNLKYDLKSAVSLWTVETKNNLDQKKRILKRVSGETILKAQNKQERFLENIRFDTRNLLQKENEHIHFYENAVRLLTPENVLKRGYTVTMKDGKIVKSVQKLKSNDEIETVFADGKVKSKITKKEQHGNKKSKL